MAGDGTTGQPHLTTADSEVAEEWADYAAASGHDVAVYPGRGCSTYRITRHRQQKVKNSALEGLRELGILFDKHIPHVYKTASRQDRLELLAGIVDTDGFLGNGYYDLTLKQVQLANDVAFLARSLGLAAYVTPAARLSRQRALLVNTSASASAATSTSSPVECRAASRHLVSKSRMS